MDEPLLTAKEVAARLKVHPRTVQRWTAEGLPALNVGIHRRADYRYTWSEVVAWLRERDSARGRAPDDANADDDDEPAAAA
jgi:excisionase family DNA binding protein